jgi:isopropylmalate/homocitrate/citramalate synthase
MSLTIKNYKQLEGWAHDYKDLRIGEIGETAHNYIFRVAYNSVPYTIKIFRTKLITNEYEMVLRDGADITQFGRAWIKKDKIEINKITDTFEKLILSSKPKATQINNPFYSNGPF